MKFRIACFLILLHCLPAHARGLPPAVTAELDRAEIPLSAVGIVVQPVGKPKPLLAVNAESAMNPASVMKLVTTSAALDLLGPAHTWTTRAFVRGALGNGVLNGDLVLQGGGDPKLTIEQFWLLLRQLRGRGLRDIQGDLVLDRSAFAPVTQDLHFDDKPLRPYNVVPDALLVGFKAMRLTLSPQGASVSYWAEPPLRGLGIVTQMRTTSGECGEWKDGLRAEQMERDGRFELLLSGTYPTSCGEQVWTLGVLPHRDYVGTLFRDLWRELGGSFSGTVRDGIAPADATPFAAIDSPPLADVVRDINKFSNNVMARELFLALATDRPATTNGAAGAVRKWLATKHIAAPGLVLDNGSGLSREERISPATLVQLLQVMAASPLMPEFVSSLPIVGVDGTMKKRLVNSDVAGWSHIKTGSLDDAKTMAGYVADSKGRNTIVVFLVNHPNARRAQAAQDALLSWVRRH